MIMLPLVKPSKNRKYKIKDMFGNIFNCHLKKKNSIIIINKIISKNSNMKNHFSQFILCEGSMHLYIMWTFQKHYLYF